MTNVESLQRGILRESSVASEMAGFEDDPERQATLNRVASDLERIAGDLIAIGGKSILSAEPA